MFYHNIYANNTLNPIFLKKSNNDLINYYKFKITQNDFKEETHLSCKIKCINWFEVKKNNYLSFNILKARNIETNESMYFQFLKYNYVIYTKQDIETNPHLQKMFYLSKFKTNLYDISSICINDGEKCNVNHYDRFYSFADYCLFVDSILKENKTKKIDYVILQTNFQQNKNLSSCENSFNDFICFTKLNNISPSDAYEVINIPVRQSLIKDNIYFVENINIMSFFASKIILDAPINGYCLSFDLESEVRKELDIKSELNILTHCGIEYFNTLYYNNFNEHKELKLNKSFSFCLINIDFHFKNKILKSSKFENDPDISEPHLYEKLRNCNISWKIKHFIEQETIDINNNSLNMIMNENCFNMKNTFDYIQKNNKKYIFMKEKLIFVFFFSMLKHIDIDYILTFNGNGYDFPQIGRRYSYLCNKKIDQVFQLPSLYNMEPIYYSESENSATSFNIKNLIIKAPYFSVDIFNYIKKFHDKLPSYSLKDIAKNIFYVEAICILQPIKNRYKLIIKNNKKFFEVLLSSNYCFINNISCKIIDKSHIINNDIIYDIDVSKIPNTIIYVDAFGEITKNYKPINVTVQLSKDDVDIASSKLYDFNTSYDIANYCIHDTILCRHLFEHYMIRNNIDIFSNLYFMQQHRSILYRNTTNIQGVLFDICLREKKFFQKSNKFYLNTYAGGKVLEPKEKFNKEPVMVFDFESLYPSIMINYNISPDKLILVLDVKDAMEYELLRLDIEERFNSEHYTVIYNTNDNNDNNVTYTITIFTKIDSDYNPKIGILSKMLIDLKKLRQYYKQEMKKNINFIYRYENCNLIQNNIKVLMNSTYGVLGSSFSNISCKFTSQSITSKGASILMFLEAILDDALIKNGKIYLNNKDNIYNPFTETYFINKQIYDININMNHPIILKVIYGDTDSIMIVPKNINKHPYLINNPNYENKSIIMVSYIGKQLNEFIKSTLIINDKLNLQFENIFLNMILQSKKKYTGISCEPIENISSIENYTNDVELKFKNINKGISTKRRDICEYQKNIIENLYKKINNIIIKARFTDDILSEDTISSNLWNFLKYEIMLLLKKNDKNKLNIIDFLISCAYTDNYKLDDNHINILVKQYNCNGRDIISKGDRFNYLYLIDISEKMSYIDTNINDYKFIYSDNIDFTKKRLCFEIYIHKIILNIVSILNNSTIIKKKLIQQYKIFIANIKF